MYGRPTAAGPTERPAAGQALVCGQAGAGHDGGRVVFEGTPAELVAARSTLTGEHLAAYVAS